MAKIAVVGVSGKQYLVSPGDELVVQKLQAEPKSTVQLPAYMVTEPDGTDFQLGAPELPKTIAAEVIEHAKSDKVRVARFKAKVRYRKVKGFRGDVTRIKIADF